VGHLMRLLLPKIMLPNLALFCACVWCTMCDRVVMLFFKKRGRENSGLKTCQLSLKTWLVVCTFNANQFGVSKLASSLSMTTCCTTSINNTKVYEIWREGIIAYECSFHPSNIKAM
jgi:hypothetical protein